MYLAFAPEPSADEKLQRTVVKLRQEVEEVLSESTSFLEARAAGSESLDPNMRHPSPRWREFLNDLYIAAVAAAGPGVTLRTKAGVKYAMLVSAVASAYHDDDDLFSDWSGDWELREASGEEAGSHVLRLPLGGRLLDVFLKLKLDEYGDLQSAEVVEIQNGIDFG